MYRLACMLAILTIGAGTSPQMAFAATHCWCECQWVSPYQRRCRKVCRHIPSPVRSTPAHQTLSARSETAEPFRFPDFQFSLPKIPTEAVVVALSALAAVLVFAGIGHFTSIARARRDIPQIANNTLRIDELRRRMDTLAHQADRMIDAYRRQAFACGRQG